jgi:hypothetical protein
MPACHGTSGSGVFRTNASALLGPVQNPAGPAELCHRWDLVTPGNTYSSYGNAPITRALELQEVKNDR